MDRKQIDLVVLLVGVLVAGILLGRFCFTQPLPANALSRIDEQKVRPGAESPENRERQSAEGNAKNSSAEYCTKASAQENAAERLAKFVAGHPNIDERCDFAKKVITELCSLGRDEEAYALIDKNAGQLRTIGMFTFYSSASLGKDELMSMVKRESFEDILPTIHGYMRGIGVDQLEAEAGSSRMEEFWRERGSEMPADLINCAITNVLQSSLTEAGHPESLKTLKLASGLVEKGTIQAYQIYELVGKDKNLNSFEKWDFLKQIDPNDAQTGAQIIKSKIRENLIDSMIRANGAKAMEDILSNQAPGQAADVNTAVRAWNNRDSAGVAGWFQQNQSTLSQEGRTMVATTLSTVAAEFGEFESARKWASQIQDPARNTEAMKMVDEKSANYQKWLESKQ